MPSQGFRLGLPPPALVVETAVEDVVTASKITVTRPGTVTHLGGWISGNPAGTNADQPLRFHLYADDGTGLNPGAFLSKTVEILVNGPRPSEECIRGAVEGAPVHVTPGVYWVGVNVGQVGGTGELILYGEASAPGIRKRNTSTYPAQPTPFPLGGVVTTNGQSAAVGVVFTQDPTEVTGSIVGTFLVGTKLVGEITIPFNTSSLTLKGRGFGVIASDSFETALMGKPKLLLKGKTTQAFVSARVSPLPAKLLLNGRLTKADVYPVVYVTQAPDLILLGKATALQVWGRSDVLNVARLYLLGRQTEGKIVGLVPPIELDLILVPTTEYETLVPYASAVAEIPDLLVPSVPKVI